jgi:phosphate transport system substrate-binding protein
MAPSSFLNSCTFVTRSSGWPLAVPASLLLACALLFLTGCTRRSPGTVEDSESSGRIRVVSVPEAGNLVARETEAFTKAYPKAGFEVVTGTSREAVRQLLECRADVAVLMRELEPEERSVMVKGGMELEGYRFARDAICVIVHPSSTLENIAADDLRRIYLGQVTDWSELGARPGRIEPVVQVPGGEIMGSFVQRVMGGAPPSAPAYRAGSDSATVARVVSTPGAIGFVSMAWADRGAKLLRVAALSGMPYWKPDAEKVYKGDYPLTRACNLYVRAGGARLANGLVTWVASIDGQRIVHETGLVPTEVPVRFARRSPLLGTH